MTLLPASTTPASMINGNDPDIYKMQETTVISAEDDIHNEKQQIPDFVIAHEALENAFRLLQKSDSPIFNKDLRIGSIFQQLGNEVHARSFFTNGMVSLASQFEFPSANDDLINVPQNFYSHPVVQKSIDNFIVDFFVKS